jgi:hypothetical protein
MSYVDAVHSRDEDRIYVVERDKNGKRQYKEYPTNYVLYYPDPRGKQRSIYGDPVSLKKKNVSIQIKNYLKVIYQ